MNNDIMESLRLLWNSDDYISIDKASELVQANDGLALSAIDKLVIKKDNILSVSYGYSIIAGQKHLKIVMSNGQSYFVPYTSESSSKIMSVGILRQ